VTIQAQILKLLRGLVKERGVSVLFTTHDLGTAYEICDRIVVMYAGQEMEAAPTAAFFERRRTRIRRLLDSRRPPAERSGHPGEVPSLIGPPPGCRFHPRCDSDGEPGAPAGRARRRGGAPRALLSPVSAGERGGAAALLEVGPRAVLRSERWPPHGLDPGGGRRVACGVAGRDAGLVGESGCGSRRSARP
jgi:hypothetical protein